MWCEHCRDHYDEDHYEDGQHKIGMAYGWTGRNMAKERLVAALLQEDVGSPSWYDLYAKLRREEF